MGIAFRLASATATSSASPLKTGVIQYTPLENASWSPLTPNASVYTAAIVPSTFARFLNCVAPKNTAAKAGNSRGGPNVFENDPTLAP